MNCKTLTIACMLVSTACTAAPNSYSECFATNGSNVTDQYCEYEGVRFMSPAWFSSSSTSSASSDQFISSSTSSVQVFTSSSAAEVPQSIRLEVPFTPQAPTANWDPPFDEACEEASYLMVEYMLQGKTFTAQSAEAAIREFVAFQKEQGYAIDISISELAQVAEQKYGRSTQVFTGNQVTVKRIEQLISEGYPVIIPAAGQLLDNPYFSGNGPPYHMLVITGYDQANFITNDPGTKRGEGFKYNKNDLVNVIHDWNGSVDTIQSGQKAMMVVR